MGIRGLNSIITRFAPDSITENDIKKYNGKIFAIDCSILIYKYVHMSKLKNSHIIGFANRINFYLKNKITPVFVFDGVPPDAKKQVLEKRQNNRKKIQERIDELNEKLKTADNKIEIENEINKLQNQVVYVNRYHIEECKTFLKYIGIPYVEACGEAEKMCVYLQKINKVDYIVSDDTDTLTFGCRTVLKTNIKNTIQEINLNDVLNNIELSYEEFVDFCILSGCDYCPFIQSIGPLTAYSLIKKYKNIEKIINLNKYKIDTDFDYITARKLFMDYSEISNIEFEFKKENIQKKELNDYLKSLNFTDHVISKYLKIFS